MRIARHDLFAGGTFIAIGAYFAIEALNYEFGTPLKMGPGFLPVTLGCALAALGAAILAKGIDRTDEAEHAPVPWRAIVLVVASIAIFGFAIRGLGFLPTVFVCAMLTSFASRTMTPLVAVLIAAGLTALSTLVFVIGLKLQVPLFGPWLTAWGAS